MGIAKKFIVIDDDNEDQLLEVFINQDDKITINVGLLNDTDNGEYYCGWCTLSKNDATALKDELERLIKIL